MQRMLVWCPSTPPQWAAGLRQTRAKHCATALSPVRVVFPLFFYGDVLAVLHGC